MLSTAARFSDYQFVIAGAPNFDISFYKQFTGDQVIPVVFSNTYNLLVNAEAAIVTSGTATLETALFHIPEVVV
ncbi:MAG: lipid-A-disaccharide synthase, partial [Chitinophagaceae bacterium]